jgi:hypothetical protein
MSAADFVVLIAAIVLGGGLVIGFVSTYREGWRHGYGAGYDDRDDETIYGDKRGTRCGRTKP